MRLLHAWMMTQSGIPVLYSGDEIGQLNDYSYHDDPEMCRDSRYVHRGKFRWDLAERRDDLSTREGRLFHALGELRHIRAGHEVFRSDAEVTPFDTGSDQVLGIRRRRGDRELTALFNFSEQPRWIWNHGRYGRDLPTGAVWGDEWIELSGYGFVWLEKELDSGERSAYNDQ